jgi:hypothetical protein
MKAAAWILGLAGMAGLIVLAVAGLTGAVAILVTGVAIIAMIGLGNVLGGRTTPNTFPSESGANGDNDAETTNEGGTIGP